MHRREHAFVCMGVCVLYIYSCVGRWEAVSVVACVYVYKCIKHTEQIGPKAKKKCSALIVCDSVEELKGILPLNHRDSEGERKRETERQRQEVKSG